MMRAVRWILSHPWLTCMLVIASIAVAAVSASRLQVRFQYRDFYDYPGNPRLSLFERHNKEFGDPAGYVVLLLETDDVFRASTLRYIRDTTQTLEALPYFSHVHSLTNARAIRSKDDDIFTGPVMPEIPETSAELLSLRDTVLHSSLLRRRLISPDGNTTAILAEMLTPAAFASVDEQRQAVAAVQQVLDQHAPPSGVLASVTGAPLVEVETTRALIADQLQLLPLVVGLLVLTLTLTFRSVAGVVLPLTAVTVALIWSLGVMAMIGRPIDIIGSIIPTTLLVYGVVDPVFVLRRVLDKMHRGSERKQAVVEAFSELMLPCLLTSVTTALGFGAFATATLPTVRNFGVIVAIGVLLAFVTTVTVLPMLLALIPIRPRAQSSMPRLELALVRASAFARRHFVWTGAAALLVLGMGVFSARQRQIVNEYVGALPHGAVQETVRKLEKKLSGVVRFIVYLEGPPGSMQDPRVLRAIHAVDQAAESNPWVTTSLSLSDVLEEMNEAFVGGGSESRSLPRSRALAAQYLALLDPEDRADFVNADSSHSQIRILAMDKGSVELNKLRDLLQAEAQRNFAGTDVTASLTGNGIVAYHECDEIVVEVLWGFVVAFGIAVLLQWVTFRSLRLALLSILPNLLPVGMCFTSMQLLGLQLRVDNSLVLCIAIGGLFNTTIHIYARVLQQVRAGAWQQEATLDAAIAAVGPPSLYTAVTLSAGFAILMASTFQGLQALGFLSMITLLSGFFSDLLVTPALLRWVLDWSEPPAPKSLREIQLVPAASLEVQS